MPEMQDLNELRRQILSIPEDSTLENITFYSARAQLAIAERLEVQNGHLEGILKQMEYLSAHNVAKEGGTK